MSASILMAFKYLHLIFVTVMFVIKGHFEVIIITLICQNHLFLLF
jgi:hypothetical protein